MLKMSTDRKTRIYLEGPTMGTHYSALFHPENGSNFSQIHADLQHVVDQVDQQMSTWKPQSNLCALNKHPVGQWLDIPHQLHDVLTEAMHVHGLSHGAFDPAVLDVVNAWGFGPELANQCVEKHNRARFSDVLDIDKSSHKIRKTKAVQLDLCGLAKGYGVDQLARVLDNADIENYLVSIDGEMVSSGHSKGSKPWQVAIEKPNFQIREIYDQIALNNASIATSGDYRHCKNIAGRHISHTMDAAKGIPIENALASVSVVHDTCMEADAWATALLVMGEEKGVAFAEQHGLNALFLMRDQNENAQELYEFRTGSLRSV